MKSQPAPLLTPADAAEQLGVKVRTLEWWRYRRTGPPFISIHRRKVRYRQEDIDAWLRANTVPARCEQ